MKLTVGFFWFGLKDRIGIIHEGFHEDRGPLTQEVEYLPFKQRVVGSSPARPTITNNPMKIVNCKL